MRTNKKNARFWIWWNDGLVKLTLKPNQELRCWRSEQHEEGWSSTLEEYLYEEEEIVCHALEDGTDCDGRQSRTSAHVCPVKSLATCYNRFSKVWMPRWNRESEFINDRFARAAGY